MTEIKYKDTVISLEAGKTATLHLADKKLTEDMVITAPAESGGGASDDKYSAVIEHTGAATMIIYPLEDQHFNITSSAGMRNSLSWTSKTIICLAEWWFVPSNCSFRYCTYEFSDNDTKCTITVTDDGTAHPMARVTLNTYDDR